MLIRHLNNRSQKKLHKVKKNRRTKQKGGSGYIANIEAPRIGGLAEITGYSQCCPMLYQGGKVAYTATGNRMCGGRRKLRKTKARKLRKTKSRK